MYILFGKLPFISKCMLICICGLKTVKFIQQHESKFKKQVSFTVCYATVQSCLHFPMPAVQASPCLISLAVTGVLARLHDQISVFVARRNICITIILYL